MDRKGDSHWRRGSMLGKREMRTCWVRWDSERRGASESLHVLDAENDGSGHNLKDNKREKQDKRLLT